MTSQRRSPIGHQDLDGCLNALFSAQLFGSAVLHDQGDQDLPLRRRHARIKRITPAESQLVSTVAKLAGDPPIELDNARITGRTHLHTPTVSRRAEKRRRHGIGCTAAPITPRRSTIEA